MLLFVVKYVDAHIGKVTNFNFKQFSVRLTMFFLSAIEHYFLYFVSNLELSRPLNGGSEFFSKFNKRGGSITGGVGNQT